MNITQSIVSERDRALIGGDYSAYHAQVVRRIQTLRRRLGTATPRGRKFTPKAPVTADNVAQNTEWVQLLLASAERSWAHAMAMKSIQSPENTQKSMAGSTKKQISSRYRRAILYATNLVEILENADVSKASSTDVLEAKAYRALLTGGSHFEKSRWKQCIEAYAIAYQIYTVLALTSRSDVFKELLASTIEPSLRYAAYQSKLPRTKAVQDISIEGFPASEQRIKSEIIKLDADAFVKSSERGSAQSDRPSTLPSSISWRSRNVKIEDAAISQALGVASDKATSLSLKYEGFVSGEVTSKDLALAFDDVIEAQLDAVDVTKNAIDELRTEGIDQGDPRVQSLQVTRTATSYTVIEWRIGRNRVLCGRDDGLLFEAGPAKKVSKLKEESSGKKFARLRERVTLYDAILQSIESVKDLPGVIADTAFIEELDGKRAYFRALKCLSIGRSHALDGAVKNALALYARALDLAQQASSRVQSSSTAESVIVKLEVTESQLQSLNSHLTSLVVQYRALTELKDINSGSKPDKSVSTQPLIETFHLNQYAESVDLKNLVNYPPKLQPVPEKPLFFDLAWNYIQYREHEGSAANGVPATKSAPEPVDEQKPAKKGWFGFGR